MTHDDSIQLLLNLSCIIASLSKSSQVPEGSQLGSLRRHRTRSPFPRRLIQEGFVGTHQSLLLILPLNKQAFFKYLGNFTNNVYRLTSLLSFKDDGKPFKLHHKMSPAWSLIDF